MEKKWWFLPNNGGGEDGMNDAGMENFTPDRLKSFVRETIQNSLDAHRSDCEDPVRVEFQKFDIPATEFPGYEQFKVILSKCKNSNEDKKTTLRLIESIISKINQEKISVLRVSDYNTTGLVGSKDSQRGSNWHNLILSRGVPNDSTVSGGSFGIGKSAVFAFSDLRSAIYGTQEIDGYKSYVGVSRLISFEDKPDELTVGQGYYSLKNKIITAIEGSYFKEYYQRNESGTDIFILGLIEIENYEEAIVSEVVSNFLVSIWRNQLIVEVDGKRIDQNNLEQVVYSLPNEKFDNIKNYYYLLSSNSDKVLRIPITGSAFHKKYGFSDDECELLLLGEDQLNSRVLMTRKPGMSLFEQDHISGSISFTGILLMTGDQMNEVFRTMEVPTHDKWAPKSCKENPKYYEQAYKQLKDAIRSAVKDAFMQPSGDEIEAFGAGDFLPEIEGSEGYNPSKTGLQKLGTRVINTDMKPPKDTTNKRLPEREEIEVEIPDRGDKKIKNPRTNPNPIEHKTTKKKYEVNYSGKKRIISMNKGCYLLIFDPQKNQKEAMFELKIVGESGELKPIIIDAKALDENVELEQFYNSKIFVRNILKNRKVRIAVRIALKDYCMMEVNYCEAKK